MIKTMLILLSFLLFAEKSLFFFVYHPTVEALSDIYLYIPIHTMCTSSRRYIGINRVSVQKNDEESDQLAVAR